MIEFEWDPEKAKANLSKHRVGFAEAATVFRDPLSITVFDPDHSEKEDRYITVGKSKGDRAVVVAHTDRGNKTRIIDSAEKVPFWASLPPFLAPKTRVVWPFSGVLQRNPLLAHEN